MRIKGLIIITIILFPVLSCKQGVKNFDDEKNQTQISESDKGWTDLSRLDQWHIYNQESVNKGWTEENGVITFDPSQGERGDLVTNAEFENFELSLEWKIDSCGNSGIMWGVRESPDLRAPYLTGAEMQILDDACHPDSKIEKHRAGDLYDMISCDPVTVKPAGQWNLANIRSENGYVVFHLNDVKVVEFQMYDESWDTMVSKSKFKDWPEFAKYPKGKIALQDHSDLVAFRNLKIRSF